jgi:hypothetical protein
VKNDRQSCVGRFDDAILLATLIQREPTATPLQSHSLFALLPRWKNAIGRRFILPRSTARLPMNRRLLLLVVAIGFTTPSTWAANVNDFLDFSLRAPNNSLLLPGRLYPPAPSASSPPLILFLHGSGQSGTNNRGQLSVNMANLLAEAKQRGAFLLAPQTNRFGGSGAFRRVS